MRYSFRGHEWVDTTTRTLDGKWESATDLDGNELRFDRILGIYTIVDGGFRNPLKLKFAEPDGIEYLILRELETKGYMDNLGLDKNSLAIDIGAHVGVVSMFLAKTYGCKVEAYEPAPHNYARLVKNIASNRLGKLIKPFNLAVTGDGRDVFFGTPMDNSGGESIYRDKEGAAVHSTTLGNIVFGKYVDLLKIDCEGAEYEIFESLEPLKRVRMIRGEFHSGKKHDTHELFMRVREVVPNILISDAKEMPGDW